MTINIARNTIDETATETSETTMTLTEMEELMSVIEAEEKENQFASEISLATIETFRKSPSAPVQGPVPRLQPPFSAPSLQLFVE